MLSFIYFLVVSIFMIPVLKNANSYMENYEFIKECNKTLNFTKRYDEIHSNLFKVLKLFFKRVFFWTLFYCVIVSVLLIVNVI